MGLRNVAIAPFATTADGKNSNKNNIKFLNSSIVFTDKKFVPSRY